MKTVDLRNLKETEGMASVCKGGAMVFGFFDGVHLGHRKLIETAEHYASGKNIPLIVWSFSSLPKASVLISTEKERLAFLRDCGADWAVLEEFTDVCDMTPDEFFSEYIMRLYMPSAVFCGFNFRYGKNAGGDTDSLGASAREHGTDFYVLPPFVHDNETVSSSQIREYISGGRIEKANEMLGYPYSITAEIISGRHLGRKIGFATINQRLPAGKVIPEFGVYACRIHVNGDILNGICNVGFRPTVNSDREDITVETHVLGECGDMYGETVTVDFLKHIRKEKKFGSVEALAEQIKKDTEAAKAFFGKSGDAAEKC